MLNTAVFSQKSHKVSSDGYLVHIRWISDLCRNGLMKTGRFKINLFLGGLPKFRFILNLRHKVANGDLCCIKTDLYHGDKFSIRLINWKEIIYVFLNYRLKEKYIFMDSSKYQALTELLKQQTTIETEWLRELGDAAFSLKFHIEKILGLEGKTYNFNHSDEKKSYIYLKHKSTDEMLNRIINSSVSNKGVLEFDLIITLEEAENAYPKPLYSFPIEVKVQNHEIFYGLSGDWKRDLDSFGDLIIENITKNLSFNCQTDFE